MSTGSERIDTGIAEIDKVEDSLSTDTMNFQFTLENEVNSLLLESDLGDIEYLSMKNLQWQLNK